LYYVDLAEYTRRAINHLKRGAMNDTTYQIFQDGQAYKVRITRVGNFIQEADGFESLADAASWVAQAKRLGAVRAEKQEPMARPHFRVV
jgi:hypothetical protein